MWVDFGVSELICMPVFLVGGPKSKPLLHTSQTPTVFLLQSNEGGLLYPVTINLLIRPPEPRPPDRTGRYMLTPKLRDGAIRWYSSGMAS
jgi:hypothetical protein